VLRESPWAGVGKTTLINAILRIMAAKKLRILLLRSHRPVHAKRMGENHRARGQKPIHRLLELSTRQPSGSSASRAAAGVAICWWWMNLDGECAVECLTSWTALPARRPCCWWVMWDQLALGGPGQVLADLINSGAPAGWPGSRRCSARPRSKGRISPPPTPSKCRHHPDSTATAG